MSKVRRDSRDEALKRLLQVADGSLTLCLAAQLCARGSSLASARQQAKERDTREYHRLVRSDGASGFLAFQWIAESLIKSIKHLSQVDIDSFWLLAEAARPTANVYETHLRAAILPLNDGLSSVWRNLENLFQAYPNNNIGVDSLTLLKELQDSVRLLEGSIHTLLKLSPPSKATLWSRITWKTVALAILIAVASIPPLYWYKNRATTSSADELAEHASSDILRIKQTAKDAPTAVPSLIVVEIVPPVSSGLLLVGALLFVARLFIRTPRTDLKRTGRALSNALRRLG